MLYESIAERYAKAIFDISKQQDSVKEWEDKLSMVLETLQSHKFLGKVLTSPRITNEVKKDMIRKVFKKVLPPFLLNFLFILVDKRRENYLRPIVKKYKEKVQEMEGIVTAQVTAAVQVSPQLELSIVQALSHYSGKKIKLECTVDPGILGGLIVQMEGRIMDWSVAGHLKRMRDKMISGLDI